MAETSRPWNGTTVGDAGPYSDANWQVLYQHIIGVGGLRANVGVFLGSGAQPFEGLRVQAQSPASASVDVLSGAALVQGIAYISTATEAQAIAANGSGNPRIDTIIVRVDYALQTSRLAVLQGTPAASPSAPSLTQTAGVMWELPLADIAVANGFATITAGNVTPRQEWVNAPPGVYLDNVVNNSGGELVSGDVVIWDSTADRAVTTTTTLGDDRAAGIWSGTTANGGYGRVQTAGIGYVKANAAITRGDRLQVFSTVKQASAIISGAFLIATALETTTGAGLVLCDIRLEHITEAYVLIQDQKAQNTAGGAFNSGAWQKRDLNTEVADIYGLASLAASVITLQPGTYRVQWSAPGHGALVRHQSRLRNTSDAIDYVGTSEAINAANTQTRSIGSVRFRITAAKNFELQHQCNTTVATNGFGIQSNFTTEVYSQIEFWREGP